MRCLILTSPWAQPSDDLALKFVQLYDLFIYLFSFCQHFRLLRKPSIWLQGHTLNSNQGQYFVDFQLVVIPYATIYIVIIFLHYFFPVKNLLVPIIISLLDTSQLILYEASIMISNFKSINKQSSIAPSYSLYFKPN